MVGVTALYLFLFLLLVCLSVVGRRLYGFLLFVLFLRVFFRSRLGVIIGVAFEGDADGLAIGRFELKLSSAAQHVHKFLDDFLVLLHEQTGGGLYVIIGGGG